MSDGGVRPARMLIRRRPRKSTAATAPTPAPAEPPDSQPNSASATAESAALPPEASPDPPDAADEPGAFLVVARVLRPHGTQGELSCEIVTEFPQRFRRTKRLFMTPPAGPGRGEPLDGATPRPYGVTRARVAPHRGHSEVILSLEGVPDRDAAEALRGWIVQVPEGEAWTLPRGRFYWHQIVGLRVVTAEGEEIGTVSEILETGANDVYVVSGSGGERLIPAIKQVITEIAPERGEMVVELIPGM
ncbi:MAG TPA: ribosome maturation factor RimM [Chloroflexota bacterium]|nr:ribosome maturation factor RimM [Chloroflexota bacterium]